MNSRNKCSARIQSTDPTEVAGLLAIVLVRRVCEMDFTLDRIDAMNRNGSWCRLQGWSR